MATATNLEELQRLAESCRVVSYKKGRTLFEQGDAADEFSVVARGELGIDGLDASS